MLIFITFLSNFLQFLSRVTSDSTTFKVAMSHFVFTHVKPCIYFRTTTLGSMSIVQSSCDKKGSLQNLRRENFIWNKRISMNFKSAPSPMLLRSHAGSCPLADAEPLLLSSGVCRLPGCRPRARGSSTHCHRLAL